MAMPAERCRKWQADFRKARGALAHIQADLQRWALLGEDSGAVQGERAKHGARLRAKVQEAKLDIERLIRELDALGVGSATPDDAKRLSEHRSELASLVREHEDLQQHIKHPLSAAPLAGATWSFGSHFVPLAAGPGEMPMPTSTPAALRPLASAGPEARHISNRQLMENQQQLMRDLDAPLAELEGTVGNLRAVSGMIHSEILSQNSMLDCTHAATDRAQGRLSRAQTFLERVANQDRSKYLLCTLCLFLVALIVIFVWVVQP